MIDEFCNTTLRATIDTEIVRGPDDIRFTMDASGVSRIILSRPPVVAVISGQVSATAQFPSLWTAITADKFKVEDQLLGVYGTTAPGAAAGGGQAVLLAPGQVGRALGRRGVEVQVTYLNGWPHAMLTADAAVGATTITVDDVTGWTGAVGVVKDAVGQEAVSCTATSPSGASASGPGTLTLASPLLNAHKAGTLVSSLPGTIEQAAILFSVSQALVRGGTALTVPNMAGSVQTTAKGQSADFAAAAKALLLPFRRVL
jgi:hypothetical protein